MRHGHIRQCVLDMHNKGMGVVMKEESEIGMRT